MSEAIGGWDVFAAPKPAVADARRQAEVLHRQSATRAALGHHAGQAWLLARLREEEMRPSYVPGQSFDHVAWHEGRKHMLREIARELFSEKEQG
jgi:hypothetical protein